MAPAVAEGPLLYDRFLRAVRQPDIARRTVERIQARAREARVFVLDDEVARRVNAVALAVPHSDPGDVEAGGRGTVGQRKRSSLWPTKNSSKSSGR
jgi:hypothetical protein